MTCTQKIIRAELGVLELGKQVGNVSQAHEMIGESYDRFYCVEDLHETGGEIRGFALGCIRSSVY